MEVKTGREIRSEKDRSTKTEMSKGWESRRGDRALVGEVLLGEKGWGGSRKALKEHPPPGLPIKEPRIRFPQGGGRRASPTSPAAPPEPRASPPSAAP